MSFVNADSLCALVFIRGRSMLDDVFHDIGVGPIGARQPTRPSNDFSIRKKGRDMHSAGIQLCPAQIHAGGHREGITEHISTGCLQRHVRVTTARWQ